MVTKRVQLLKTKITVQSHDSSSAQATVFFGRETNLGIKVVLKQYTDDLRGMFREIKIFTELERLKKRDSKDDIARLLEEKHQICEALPNLLCYSAGKDNQVAEILMTNGGKNLAHWKKRIKFQDKRMRFMLAMLTQVQKGLKQLHSLGYSHGDLKLENICARPGSNGQFKFTLVDLGVSSKLSRIGQVTKHKNFRGNLLTASPDHLRNRRAGPVDDFYSLLCVAYYFVFGSLPWRDYTDEYFKNHYMKYQNKTKTYIHLRKKKAEEFDIEMIHEGKELRELFEHVCSLRKMRNALDEFHWEKNIISKKYYQMDCKNFAVLLPQKYIFSQHELDIVSPKPNARELKVPHRRSYSSLSDYRNDCQENLNREVLQKLKLLEPFIDREDRRLDPEQIYDKIRVSLNKRPKYNSRSQEDYRKNLQAIPSSLVQDKKLSLSSDGNQMEFISAYYHALIKYQDCIGEMQLVSQVSSESRDSRGNLQSLDRIRGKI